MNIQTLVLQIGKIPGFSTNCYIVSESETADQAIVIDPADQFAQIQDALGKRQVAAIILTHRHDDHTSAASQLVQASAAPIYAHELDVQAIEHPQGHYPSMIAEERNPPVVTNILHDGDVVNIAGVELQVLHTPGHSAGSICLYNAKDAILFSGDTLFYGTTGRTDLASGSPQEMHQSLLRLAELPDNVDIYPGHDRPTTIANERHRALVEY
jgi:glyoxylase-like metal-dependent hydrolase (beta-lactamase superfamily II)